MFHLSFIYIFIFISKKRIKSHTLIKKYRIQPIKIKQRYNKINQLLYSISLFHYILSLKLGSFLRYQIMGSLAKFVPLSTIAELAYAPRGCIYAVLTIDDTVKTPCVLTYVYGKCTKYISSQGYSIWRRILV